MMAAVEENSANLNKRKFQQNANEIDEPAQKRFNMEEMEEVISTVNILDLDSYVLLNIFKYCDAPDLKALAFTCTRFASLVVDRSLWYTVDATSKPHGSVRLQWYMDNCLHKGTKVMHIIGHALRDTKCSGLSLTSKATEEKNSKSIGCTFRGSNRLNAQEDPNWQRVFRDLFHLTNPSTKSIYWPLLADRTPRYHENADCGDCIGPIFTLSRPLLVQLRHKCSLTELKLEYCNIDYPANPIAFFPPKLRLLSLRGTRCFNARTRSYICGIHEYLPLLEELDVSACDWLEPAALLPLSKLPCLQKLSIVRCLKFTECVAYAALATRNGFKSLKILDARQSPLTDSEVSSFGWVFSLEEFYLESGPTKPDLPQHLHYPDDPVTSSDELEEWEMSEAANYFNMESTEKLQSESRGDVSKSACLGRIFTSTLKRNAQQNQNANRNASGSSDEALPPKKRRAENTVNEGASTSRDALAGNEALWDSEDEDAGPSANSGDCMLSRQTEQPSGRIIIASLHGAGGPETRHIHMSISNNSELECCASSALRQSSPSASDVEGDDDGDSSSSSSSSSDDDDDDEPPKPRDNVVPIRRNNLPMLLNGPPVHPWAPVANAARDPANGPIVVQVNPIGNLRRLRSINNLVCPSICLRQKEPTEASLVTDSALYKFGMSDNIVGYVDIGVRLPHFDTLRPEKTKLRVLVCRGYHTVTDRVLRHFVTAAPDLRHLDLRGTSVTRKAVENFQNLRPECEVLFGY